MLQQTPLLVTVAPPSAETLPPEEAALAVIPDGDVTETTGAVFGSSFLQLIKIHAIRITK